MTRGRRPEELRPRPPTPSPPHSNRSRPPAPPLRAARAGRGDRRGAGRAAGPFPLAPRLYHVARAEGPERIAAEWWRDGTTTSPATISASRIPPATASGSSAKASTAARRPPRAGTCTGCSHERRLRFSRARTWSWPRHRIDWRTCLSFITSDMGREGVNDRVHWPRAPRCVGAASPRRINGRSSYSSAAGKHPGISGNQMPWALSGSFSTPPR